MANFDLKNAQAPRLTGLENSFANGDYEKELKEIFLEIYRQHLSETVFDANVAGNAHLGSFDLVRKSVNYDGLTLLRGDLGENAARYIYRAWKGADVQGRGMHFLRTYLQVLFPNLTEVLQLWHHKDVDYPHGLISRRDGPNVIIDPETQFLTSRIEIAIDLGLVNRSITNLVNTIRSIIPARLVPHFRFCIIFDTTFDYGVDSWLYMNKHSSGWLEWCGLVITDRPSRIWQLGRVGESFNPKLRSCRVTGWDGYGKSIVVNYPRIHRIGEPGLKVDGTWAVPTHRPMSAEADISLVRAN